ncbi:MAG: DUF2726 domain-containing protein [Lautropia sp.]
MPEPSPGWIAATIAALVLLAGCCWLLFGRRRTPGFRVVRRPLLTENELEFLQRLEAAFPDYRVMAQVSMGALMAPDVPGGSPDFLSIRARFAQKVVDFVLLDGAFEVVALVELDDRTHRTERDAARDAMTAAAGYVTLRYQSRDKPEPIALRAELARLHAALRR